MAKSPAPKVAKSIKKANNSTKRATTVSKSLLVGASLFFIVIFAGFVAFTNNQASTQAPIGGPFQLTTHTGSQLTDKELLGKPFLVFFGYTHCPDVCHTTLFEMSEILRALGANAKINALFVTVDPARDTPHILQDYLSNFDPRIIGLTGSPDQLEPMLKEYRIYAKRTPGTDSDYAVDHTTAVYLMDKNGHFVSPFNVSRRPYDAAREIEKFL